ncbi:MAG: protein-glutamate O-methyltransferase CheR [Chitinivibrionales bacterium]|nr:protein-glutamate O-methyltransferase CheR [Chitinivibrionales bacterium]
MVQSKIDKNEFQLLRNYIEENCGIHIIPEKMYLVETRLTTLMVENGCLSFTELYQKAVNDKNFVLRDKIIDAMTTNETYWFRDITPFKTFEEVLMPEWINEIDAGKRLKIRIWSAASSTGQEPYSLVMVILELMKKHPTLKPEHIEILATDISPTVLFLAKSGRYDNIAISRGLPDDLKKKYFQLNGKIWAINEEIKKMVTFKKFNLQEQFLTIGKQDVIFCRNVLIYFSENFKKNILQRLTVLLKPNGYLFLGSAESIMNYSNDYRMQQHGKGLYYKILDK